MFSRLYNYRNLLIVFVWREFIVRYKQAIFGVAWALFQPLSMMLLFVVVFGFALHIDTGDIPYPLFFYSGLVPWIFFSNSLNYSIPSLTNHYSLLTKIYFPREIIPLAGIVVFSFDLLISSALYGGMMLFYGYHFQWKFLLVIPLLLIMFCFTLALSLLLSSLNVFYRDVKMASAFILQIFFFLSPVFYTLESVDSRFKSFLFLNPLSFVIESIRSLTLHGALPDFSLMLIYFFFVLIFMLFSWRIFIKMERAFADVI